MELLQQALLFVEQHIFPQLFNKYFIEINLIGT